MPITPATAADLSTPGTYLGSTNPANVHTGADIATATRRINDDLAIEDYDPNAVAPITQDAQNIAIAAIETDVAEINDAYPSTVAAFTEARADGRLTSANIATIKADIAARLAANSTAVISASYASPNLSIVDDTNATPTVIPLDVATVAAPTELVLSRSINAASVAGGEVIIERLDETRFLVVANDGNQITATDTPSGATIELANGVAHVTLTADETVDFTVTAKTGVLPVRPYNDAAARDADLANIPENGFVRIGAAAPYTLQQRDGTTGTFVDLSVDLTVAVENVTMAAALPADNDTDYQDGDYVVLPSGDLHGPRAGGVFPAVATNNIFQLARVAAANFNDTDPDHDVPKQFSAKDINDLRNATSVTQDDFANNPTKIGAISQEVFVDWLVKAQPKTLHQQDGGTLDLLALTGLGNQVIHVVRNTHSANNLNVVYSVASGYAMSLTDASGTNSLIAAGPTSFALGATDIALVERSGNTVEVSIIGADDTVWLDTKPTAPQAIAFDSTVFIADTQQVWRNVTGVTEDFTGDETANWKLQNPEATDVVYPADAAGLTVNAENILYLDHTLNIPGDFPAAASGQWIGVSIIQANSTDTQAVKDAAKKRTSTWSAFDTGAGFIWVETDAGPSAGFSAHQEVVLPHDAANSDVTPENTDTAIASVGIKPSRLPFTAPGQKVAYNITDSGDIVAYVVKHTGTAFTLQLQETATPANGFAVDLAADGTLSQPVADPTNELTGIIANVADDDQWWRVTFRGDRPENVTMRVWGNDIGDATDFQSEILFALQVVPDTGQHQIRLTKLTNAAAVEDTTVVAYPKTDGSAVLTIDSVPANEVIRDVVFYQRGTTTAVTGSFNRLQSNVITISEISEDTDIEIVTDTIVAPELRLVRSSFKMVPGAADVSPSSTTWAATTEYTKTINLTPNSKATISIPSVTGYSAGNATIGYVIGVLDSSDNLIAGGHRATVAVLDTVADAEPWAARMATTVVANARNGWPTVAIPEFTVPADGVVKFVFAPFGAFRVDGSGSGQTVMVETVDNVTIAAIDRIQTPRTVTLTGSTFHTDSPNRNSDTQATVYENLSNQVWVGVPAGQKIVSVSTVPTNKATLGDLDLTNQRQAVNISTDMDVALTVTLGSVTGIHDITIFNFQTDNAVLGPSIANGDVVDNIGGWRFDARSDTRQARLHNVSGRRRFVRTASIWRGASSTGSNFPSNTYPNHTFGFETGQARQLNPTNVDFSVGGGAADGQVEYGIYEVFEFPDDADRLEYNKIHEIWVSMAVGHSWINTDWRVKLVTWGN